MTTPIMAMVYKQTLYCQTFSFFFEPSFLLPVGKMICFLFDLMFRQTTLIYKILVFFSFCLCSYHVHLNQYMM